MIEIERFCVRVVNEEGFFAVESECKLTVCGVVFGVYRLEIAVTDFDLQLAVFVNDSGYCGCAVNAFPSADNLFGYFGRNFLVEIDCRAAVAVHNHARIAVCVVEEQDVGRVTVTFEFHFVAVGLIVFDGVELVVYLECRLGEHDGVVVFGDFGVGFPSSDIVLVERFDAVEFVAVADLQNVFID